MNREHFKILKLNTKHTRLKRVFHNLSTSKRYIDNDTMKVFFKSTQYFEGKYLVKCYELFPINT